MKPFTVFLRTHPYSKTGLGVFAGVLLGVLLLGGVRFIAYSPKVVHYHANFAVYINGVREEFKSYTYYEEVAQCNLEAKLIPTERAHMHQPENDTVHVHADAVTWGNFFENLGWSVGDNFVATRDEVFANTADKKVTFIINDKEVPSIAGRVIGDEEHLLISYGGADKNELLKESATIRNTAHRFNETPDPASCSGESKPTWRQRLRHVI